MGEDRTVVVTVRFTETEIGILDKKSKALGQNRSDYLRSRVLAHRVPDPDAPCRHPINRRIGSECAVCGATVKGRT